MKAAILLVTLGLSALAQKPIPKEKHEDISMQMLKLQAAQVEFQQTQMQHEAAVANLPTKQRLNEALQKLNTLEVAYRNMVEKLRSEYSAKNCELTIEKDWQCPQKPEVAKAQTTPDSKKENK